MSATYSQRSPDPAAPGPPAPGPPAPGPLASSAPIDDRCDVCGTPLVEGQEWCLECGASRTLIHPPPDWRTGLLIVVVVVALALAGFGYALNRLSDGAGRQAGAIVSRVHSASGRPTSAAP
jgi:hypothetical protein